MTNSKRKFRSIKTKLLSVIGISSLIIIVVLIAYNTKVAHDEAIMSSQEEARSLVQEYAAEVEFEINKALETAHDLAYTFSSVKDEEFALDIDRDEANSILKHVLEGNDTYYGVYCVWEPNEFDGKDAFYYDLNNRDTIYPNMEGNDSLGHFVPYWFRYNDLFLQEPTYAYGQYWYEQPKSTKAEMVVDPTIYQVNNEDVMLVTLEAPILHDGEFYGLTGVDISINWLQERINEAQLYDGQAHLSIISNNGTIAATSLSDTLAGKLFEELVEMTELQKTSLSGGKENSFMNEEFLDVYVPIDLGDGRTPWQVAISVPTDIITAEATDQMYRSIYISLILISLALFIIWFFVNRLVLPLTSMVKVANKMAEGILTQKESLNVSNDEIGSMASALSGLSNGLKRTSEFAHQVGQGNLDAEFEALSTEDVLGNSLLEMRDNLKKIAQDDLRRNWSTKGQAELGDILREGNDSIEELAYNVLHKLIKYLNANQGGIYLFDKEAGANGELELVAVYAWDHKKYMNQRFEPGEGLAGQCLLERKEIYLEKVPESYIKITSGVGKALPRAVLLMPLMLNEEVEGIIELASFHQFEQHQIEFIQTISSTFASTFAQVKNNQLTRELLNKSHKAREEIQASEEELRQNMEELSSTQEEMQRVQKEMLRKEETMFAMINSSKDTYFAIDTNYRILSINESVQKRMANAGIHLEVGSIVLEVFDDEMRAFWKERYDRALNGESYMIPETRETEEGTIYIEGYYAPLKNATNETIGCYVISRDVTQLKLAQLEIEELKSKLDAFESES